jgi:hypothetical protein
MSYKLKYKEALKAAGITENDLLPKLKKQVGDIEKLQGVLADADEDDKEDIEEAIEGLDSDLCKKIPRNEQMKATVAKMQGARGKGKQVIIEPVKEPKKEEPKVKVEETKEKEVIPDENSSSGTGWFFGIAASIVGLAFVGKWQKWF